MLSQHNNVIMTSLKIHKKAMGYAQYTSKDSSMCNWLNGKGTLNVWFRHVSIKFDKILNIKKVCLSLPYMFQTVFSLHLFAISVP